MNPENSQLRIQTASLTVSPPMGMGSSLTDGARRGNIPTNSGHGEAAQKVHRSAHEISLTHPSLSTKVITLLPNGTLHIGIGEQSRKQPAFNNGQTLSSGYLTPGKRRDVLYQSGAGRC